MDNCQREDAKAVLPSALPEFAEIFSFLNNFGPLLSLPPVSLIDLESFFNGGNYMPLFVHKLVQLQSTYFFIYIYIYSNNKNA